MRLEVHLLGMKYLRNEYNILVRKSGTKSHLLDLGVDGCKYKNIS
jgi:hypothetical protein